MTIDEIVTALLRWPIAGRVQACALHVRVRSSR
jgi:hypothetical protein